MKRETTTLRNREYMTDPDSGNTQRVAPTKKRMKAWRGIPEPTTVRRFRQDLPALKVGKGTSDPAKW